MANQYSSDRINSPEPYKYVFLFCLAVLAGSSYQLYVSIDWTLITDGFDYLKMSEGDLNVTITRRYRVVTPFIARILSIPFEYVTAHIWPHRSGSDWTIRFCFFLENIVTMAFAGTFIYDICRSYKATVISALFATAGVLLSRWGTWFTVVPNSDAIYLLVIVLSVWGIKSSRKWPLIIAIFVGPFAKESFIFVAPMIVLFGRDTIKLPIQILLFGLSGLIVFSFRYWLDMTFSVAYSESIVNAFNHLELVEKTYERVFSLRGLGELFGVWGIFTLVIIVGFLKGKNARHVWMKEFDWLMVFLLCSIVLHAVISSEVSRMLYFGSPVFAVSFALILDKHPYFTSYREWILNKKLD